MSLHIYPNHTAYIADIDAYTTGLNRILECHSDIINMHGGGYNIETITDYLSKLLNKESRYKLSMVLRSLIRTGAGASADALTGLAGGDVPVNAVFAINTTSKFIKNINTLIKELMGAYELFNSVFRIDMTKSIPIVVRFNLDKGYSDFQIHFDSILSDYVKKYDTIHLDKIMDSIRKTIDRITTVVSDWIACLFPDTAGLAGDLAKGSLDYIVNNGYTIIYQLTSFLPDKNQQMITNKYALEKFIKESLIYLRNFLRGMNDGQITQIIEAFGDKLSDTIDGSFKKGVVNIGTHAISSAASVASKVYQVNAKLSKYSIMPQAQTILASIIDKIIIPHVGSGVELFDQMFPIFLTFAIFIERYDIITNPNSGYLK